MADTEENIVVVVEGFTPEQAREEIKVAWPRTQPVEGLVFRHDEPYQSSLVAFHPDLPTLFAEEFDKHLCFELPAAPQPVVVSSPPPVVVPAPSGEIVKVAPTESGTAAPIPPTANGAQMTIGMAPNEIKLKTVFLKTPNGDFVVFGIPEKQSLTFGPMATAKMPLTIVVQEDYLYKKLIVIATPLAGLKLKPGEVDPVYTVDGEFGEFIRIKFRFDKVAQKYYVSLIGAFFPQKAVGTKTAQAIGAKTGTVGECMQVSEVCETECWDLESVSVAAQSSAGQAFRYWIAGDPTSNKFKEAKQRAKLAYVRASERLMAMEDTLGKKYQAIGEVGGTFDTTKTIYSHPALVVAQIRDDKELKRVSAQISATVDRYTTTRNHYTAFQQKAGEAVDHEEMKLSDNRKTKLMEIRGVISAELTDRKRAKKYEKKYGKMF